MAPAKSPAKRLDRAKRKMLETHQDLQVADSLGQQGYNRQKRELRQRYRALRENVIHLARALGSPDYLLEEELDREVKREKARHSKRRSRQSSAESSGLIRDNRWINELPPKPAPKRKKGKRPSVDPDGYYYLLIGRGVSPELALERVTKKYRY